jgi:hypothetical protein
MGGRKPKPVYETIDPMTEFAWEDAPLLKPTEFADIAEGLLCRALQLDRNIEFASQYGEPVRAKTGDHIVMVGVGTKEIFFQAYEAAEFSINFAAAGPGAECLPNHDSADADEDSNLLRELDRFEDFDDTNMTPDERRVFAELDRQAAEDPEGIWGPLDSDEDVPLSGPGL